jgi:imidazolonepropionase-like amidohydrolase
MKTGIKNVCLQTDIILPINFFHLLPIYVIKKAATYVEALRMVTICPANVLGLVNQIGILEKGKEADIVLLNKH